MSDSFENENMEPMTPKGDGGEYTPSDTQRTPVVPAAKKPAKEKRPPDAKKASDGTKKKSIDGTGKKTSGKPADGSSAKPKKAAVKPADGEKASKKEPAKDGKKHKKQKEKAEIIYIDKKKKEEPVKTDEEGNPIVYKNANPLRSIVFTVLYIVVILMVAATLSAVIIAVANDVFAFQKTEVTAEIALPEYTTTSDLAEILHENGIINYPGIFKLYASLKKSEVSYVTEPKTVDSSMNYEQLIRIFRGGIAQREEVTITIPEGYTVDEIIDLFLENGIGTREGFIDAIQNGEYDYEFVRRLDAAELSPDRRYRLEGYLFPDTYFFYQDWSETLVINKILDNFNVKFPASYYEYIDKTGMSVDDFIIIASMVQGEAKYAVDFENISAVFHNRLKDPARFPYLESDATIQYAYGEHKEELSHEDTEFDHPYNTYKYKGLPPGPICNPGATAISNAISPPENFNYYYFVASSDGSETYYARTYEEHLKNIALARGQA